MDSHILQSSIGTVLRTVKRRFVLLLALLMLILLISSYAFFGESYAKLHHDGNFAVESTSAASNTRSRFSQTNLARQEHLRRVCQLGLENYTAAGISDQRLQEFRVNTDLKLIYCPVFKVGTTFWFRVFNILTGKFHGKQLFDIKVRRKDTLLPQLSRVLAGKRLLQNYHFLHTSKKFLFVRDPFERLFSAFMDKIFSESNTLRLIIREGGRLGSQSANITDTKRGNSPATRQPCGNVRKVTFLDTIRYAIDEGARANQHFMPFYSLCSPCHVDYDFIGKMETFMEDAESVLAMVGVKPEDVFATYSNLTETSDTTMMEELARSTFTDLRQFPKCYKPFNSLRRIWTIFQARGFLSINRTFPLTEAQANKVTLSQFLQLIKEAYAFTESPGQRKVIRQQRKMAMMEAYYSLPRSLLKQLQESVQKDCDLFDYECDVDVRFNVSMKSAPVFHFDQL